MHQTRSSLPESHSSKHDVIQVATPGVTKKYDSHVVITSEYNILKVYNPSAGDVRLSVYKESKDSSDIGQLFSSGFAEYINVPIG